MDTFKTYPVKKIAYYRRSMRFNRVAMNMTTNRREYEQFREDYYNDFNAIRDLVFSVLISFDEE